MEMSLDTVAATTFSASAVRALYLAHGAELRQALARLVPELDANDLLQELFVIALRNGEALARADSPRAWLYGTAIKLAATRRRTARLRRFLGLEDAESVAAVDASSITAEQRDAQRLIQRALEGLSPAKREVIVLFELQGLSGEDVASALNIPLKTVWTRLHHARKELSASVERLTAVEARTSGLSKGEVRP